MTRLELTDREMQLVRDAVAREHNRTIKNGRRAKPDKVSAYAMAAAELHQLHAKLSGLASTDELELT